MAFERVPLGATGMTVSRIGVASSYGLDARGVEQAFERGIDYFYWGSLRRASFGRGLSDLLARDRDRVRVCVQSYSRSALLLGWSLERALQRLRIECADVLLLGLWNELPPERILEAATREVERGRARALMISCHHRPTFARIFAEPRLACAMLRYNAAHPGAETDVFPHYAGARTALVAYTATCWGRLVDPRRTPSGLATPRASDCYRFALTRPELSLCLSGPRDEHELQAAFEALERGPLDPQEVEWMKRVGAACR
jgi:aryl-alcohol dehydrogenase-like predicted oxidoreductase